MSNAKSLAMRDPAMASLMGAIGADGSDFGADDLDFGAEVSYESHLGWEDGMGWEDSAHGDFGAWTSGFGADVAPAAGITPTPQQAMQAWHGQRAMAANRAKRHALLYPNKGSDVKIEGYQFALSAALVLGTASTITVTQTPDTELRPRRVSMNAPAPGFVTFTQLQVSNVNTLVGGISDAYFYNANGQGQGVSYPTLNPSTKATFNGAYTGYVPPGFAPAQAFLFVIEFKGPASMTA